jgi:dehydrogenase/reductase SDR family member 12
MKALANIVDRALEATVVGSFSRIGYDVRSRVNGWSDPSPLKEKTVLITGATSGIGKETAIELASLGASVRVIARNEAKSKEARDEIVRASGNHDVEFYVADMSDFDSIRNACQELITELDVLDLLVHNAGSLAAAYTVASSGNEITVASQVLGPFLLTRLLTPLLHRASPGRVITVSSGGMYSERFDLGRLEMNASDYNGVHAYARAKRAQVVLNREWARRTDKLSIIFCVMHPGWVNTPGVSSSLPRFHRYARPLLRSAKQGADTIIWLATSSEVESSSGEFWFDRRTRWEHRVPWTVPRNHQMDQLKLWNWCIDRTMTE